MDVKGIQEKLARFAAERDWDQFHSPKNLSMALAGEAAELLEIFQWLTEEQSKSLDDPARRQAAAEELADIAIYTLRLADKLKIDLESAIHQKIEINARTYPVEQSRGKVTRKK